MARYNQWMNQKLYAKVAQLSDEDIAKDRGAFFPSILHTLNHILVGDLLWFRRFTSSKACKEHLTMMKDMPRPTSLDELLFTNIQALREHRNSMDKLILDFSHTWSESMLQSDIRYRDTEGNKHQRSLGVLLHQVCNHQTHHRGQVTALLFQAGIDPEATDLLVMMMEENR
ncbi:MAG: DinB family protein [Mariprofundaceae bacterium]|nr:DinB family protein [Mariprofundaceae bacterium]